MKKHCILIIFACLVFTACEKEKPKTLDFEEEQIDEPVLITTMDFSDESLLEYPYWTFGSQLGGTLTFENGYAHGEYPPLTKQGGVYVWLSCKIMNYENCDTLSQLFIEFDARMPSESKGGMKFCKVFGQSYENDPENIGVSNCTFGLEYTTGAFLQVSYGDGAELDNDTKNTIVFDGSITSNIGRAPNPEINYYDGNTWEASDWGNEWHHFKLMVKFNDGTTAENEIPNGEFYIEIDDVPYVKVKNIFNRNYNSAPIRSVGFFNQSQGEGHPGFSFDYDNIKISKNGFMQ